MLNSKTQQEKSERDCEVLNLASNRLRFTPDWRAAALALILLPLVMPLGFWQLDRAQEKRDFKALYLQRQSAGPIEIDTILKQKDLQYQPVRLKGQFINEKTLLLDNRIFKGQFGYEVVVPFKLQGSELLVLVNRGWIVGDRSRRTLPFLENDHFTASSIELVGEVHVPQSEMMTLSDDIPPVTWPHVTQSLNIENLTSEFKLPLFPYEVRLREGSIAGLQANWMVVNIEPRKHIAYAVQWFSMGIALLLIVFLTNTNFISIFKRFFKKA